MTGGKKTVPISPGSLDPPCYYKRRTTPITKLAEALIAFDLIGEIGLSDKYKMRITEIYTTYTKEEYVQSLKKRVEEIEQGKCQVKNIREYYVEKVQLPKVEKAMNKLKGNETKELLICLATEFVHCQKVRAPSDKRISSIKVPAFLKDFIQGTNHFLFF